MLGLIYKDLKINLFMFIMTFLCTTFFNTMLVIAGTMGNTEGGTTVFLLLQIMSMFISYITLYCISSSIFNTDERKKWAYFVTSTPESVKGQVGSKYVLNLVYLLFFSTYTEILQSIVSDMAETENNMSIVIIIFTFVGIMSSAIEFPFIVRWGSSVGSYVKVAAMLIVCLAAGVYFLFGDLSAFGSIDSFYDKLLGFINDSDSSNKLIFGISLAAFLLLPIYYLSYRISCKAYLKGAETYAK